MSDPVLLALITLASSVATGILALISVWISSRNKATLTKVAEQTDGLIREAQAREDRAKETAAAVLKQDKAAAAAAVVAATAVAADREDARRVVQPLPAVDIELGAQPGTKPLHSGDTVKVEKS